MNKSKFKKYLTKIKSFENWIDSDEELSKIELSLLSDYIKKLYESVIEDIIHGGNTHFSNKTDKKENAIENSKELIQEENIDEIGAIENSDDIEKTKNTISIDQTNSDTEEKPEEIKTIKDYSPEFLSIFSNNGASELSEKLSLRPISNLKKAFGINEKIFTINELFGGKKSEFNTAIEKLNDFHDFEEAKEYILEELTPVFDWDKSKKIKKVEQFIKTVRRRYIK